MKDSEEGGVGITFSRAEQRQTDREFYCSTKQIQSCPFDSFLNTQAHGASLKISYRLQTWFENE